MQPLAGYRIGVTAARKVEEQVTLLERRGAVVVRASALSTEPPQVDLAALRQVTERVVEGPVDLVLATTGIGMRSWFAAADVWGLADALVEALTGAEILARGPKTVGALRRRGLQETWAAQSEELAEMIRHLEGRDLNGCRIVLQEHGQSLSTLADTLRGRGAEVTAAAIYRIAPTDEPLLLRALLDAVCRREVDAVTFTSAPAVSALMQEAEATGRRDAVVAAFRGPVLASCVGPVTAAAFEVWGVPSVFPERSRLAAMVKQLEIELPARTGLSS